jgi:hypothetical protein
MGMGMSFFAPCPSTGGLSVPRKSGHTRNADLTIVCHGGRCPDLSGSACAFIIGHETKKDIPMPMRLTKENYVALTKGQDLLSKT